MKYLIVLMACLIPVGAMAEPTPNAKTIFWTHSGNDVAGFYLYWADESEPPPRIYDDIRKVNVPDSTKREIILLAVMPDVSKKTCFKLTAYDASGNESSFTDEVCGFFGLETPLGFGVK